MNILLGVTGGIAAYKAAELCSLSIKRGHSVRVIMTQGATQFVGPLTFEGLTGEPVMTTTWAIGAGSDGVSAIEHISWAKWANVACIAPLTANTLAKLACGIADDALTTVWMALPVSTPSILCPAMNTQMWEQPVTKRNRGWIDALGRHHWVDPVAKRLACGDVGVGGLAAPEDILQAIEAAVP